MLVNTWSSEVQLGRAWFKPSLESLKTIRKWFRHA